MSVELSVVIPTFDSQAILPELCRRLVHVLDGLDRSYEIIFVDDHSPQPTWQTLEACQRQYPGRITILRLTHNVGQHLAVLCGLRVSSGRLVATMDDDLQHPPEELPKLIRAIEQSDAELVYGIHARYHYTSHMRAWLGRFASWYARTVYSFPVRPTSFRVMRRPVVDALVKDRRAGPVIDFILMAFEPRTIGVYVEQSIRAHGASTYSFAKIARLSLDALTAGSLALMYTLGAGGAALVALSGLIAFTVHKPVGGVLWLCLTWFLLLLGLIGMLGGLYGIHWGILRRRPLDPSLQLILEMRVATGNRADHLGNRSA